MPRFWVDATPIRGRLSGIGYYTLNAIAALYSLQAREGFELEVYCHPSLKNWLLRRQILSDRLQPYSVKTLPLPVTLADAIAQISPQLLPPADQSLGSPDLLHGTDHYVYPRPSGVPKVMTIHDLTFLKYPQYSTQIVQTYRSRIQRCLRWTDLIITFAESTKRDIVEYFGVNPAKIVITPQASRYQNCSTDIVPLASVKSAIACDLSRPYLLFVSTLEPRKNVVGLIAAFNYLKQTQNIPHQLVLIGQKGWKYGDILTEIARSPYTHDIHHLDYLSEDALAYCYTHADAFIYPSFYEGFGLPVLEAMTLGAPVVTSNVSSLPEVAGEAAILVDPYDMGAIASGISQVIDHPSQRQALIERGKARAKLFSWQKTAQLTLAAYRSLLN